LRKILDLARAIKRKEEQKIIYSYLIRGTL